MYTSSAAAKNLTTRARHLFDVSLRDGIQSAKNAEKYTTENKKRILDKIIRERKPDAIEVGSYVSPKIMPIMEDTEKLLEYGLNQAKYTGIHQNFYVLVPNAKQMTRVVRSPVINKHIHKQYASINFSFITSISESFQKKNTNMSLEQTKLELGLMTRWLSHFWPMSMTKLYVSCINECPIEGPLNNAKVVTEIMEYNCLCDFDEICLSDTKGSLAPKDLDSILRGLSIIPYLPPGKLSLHLHGTANEERVRELLKVADKRGITQFDVSTIEEGGCSVTMGKNGTKPNLTYETVTEAINKL